MSHISVAVEYALHCLIYLVDWPHNATSPSARDLAELRKLPVKYVAGIMTKLAKGGVIVSVEGVRGGIRLARPPEQISFLDVITAVDGKRPVFDCRGVREHCALFDGEAPAFATSGICSIHAVMLEGEARMKDVFRARTLRDMADQAAKRVPSEFRAEGRAWLLDRGRNRA